MAKNCVIVPEFGPKATIYTERHANIDERLLYLFPTVLKKLFYLQYLSLLASELHFCTVRFLDHTHIFRLLEQNYPAWAWCGRDRQISRLSRIVQSKTWRIFQLEGCNCGFEET